MPIPTVPPPVQEREFISFSEMATFLAEIGIEIEHPDRFTRRINEILAQHHHESNYPKPYPTESRANLDKIRKQCDRLIEALRAIDDDEILMAMSVADESSARTTFESLDQLDELLHWLQATVDGSEIDIPRGRARDKPFDLTAARLIRAWHDATGRVGSIANNKLDEGACGRSFRFYRFVGRHIGWDSVKDVTLRNRINTVARAVTENRTGEDY